MYVIYNVYTIYIPHLFFFLAALGLRCYAWAFSSCGKWGLLFVVAHRLIIAVASLLLQSMGSRHVDFSSCSTQALEHVGFSSCGTQAQ